MQTEKLHKYLDQMNDEDPSVRRSAVEGLAEGDERAVYPLIKALRDDNLGVQDAAMRSLMEIRTESAAYMVLPLLRENSFLRNTALIILKDLGQIVIPLLYVLLSDKDDDVRKFALDLIYEIEFCDYPDKLVEMLTGDPNANVRAAAAKALGRLQYKEGTPHLIRALIDEEWVCFSALEALTELKDESALDPIVSLLKSPSETTRFAAIEALGNICSPKVTQPLVDHIPEANEFEKKTIIKSLAQIGSMPPLSGVSKALREMLSEDDWDDKMIAIKGLVLLNETEAIGDMLDLTGSLDPSEPDNEDRIYLIKESIKNFGCNEQLLNVLTDDTCKYRSKSIAAELAGDLQCSESAPLLIELLKSKYRDVRRSSIESLGKIDSEVSRECLLEVMSDEDSHVRKSAVIALGKISAATVLEDLMNMLHKEEYDDVIDEYITSLMNMNSTLFLSRLDQYDTKIQERVSLHMSGSTPEAAC